MHGFLCKGVIQMFCFSRTWSVSYYSEGTLAKCLTGVAGFQFSDSNCGLLCITLQKVLISLDKASSSVRHCICFFAIFVVIRFCYLNLNIKHFILWEKLVLAANANTQQKCFEMSFGQIIRVLYKSLLL